MGRFKIIQVPVDEALLRSLDAESQKRQQSRAALVREACAKYLERLEEHELNRRYIEGYRRMRQQDTSFAEAQEAELAEFLADDDWED